MPLATEARSTGRDDEMDLLQNRSDLSDQRKSGPKPNLSFFCHLPNDELMIDRPTCRISCKAQQGEKNEKKKQGDAIELSDD